QNRLSQLLQIPEAVTAKALQFLTKTKLLNERTDGTFEIGTTKMHLGSDSPLVAKHHANWRLKALNDLDMMRSGHPRLHYSSVISVSAEDASRIETILLQCIDQVKEIVRQSDDPTNLLCF